jgi:hypothetical protein
MTNKKHNDNKKIVSLTLDPALVAKIDEYAASHKKSRSAVIEYFIHTALFEPERPIPVAPPVNSLVQPESIFASPEIGQAIFY